MGGCKRRFAVFANAIVKADVKKIEGEENVEP
jgi:hypothetical protein